MQSNEYGIDLPYIPADLLAALEERYPDRCPHIEDSGRLIWLKTGQRQVITYLADQKRRQQETDKGADLDILHLEERA